jgi:glycosyltransferase involved in cell wall biosynthesis
MIAKSLERLEKQGLKARIEIYSQSTPKAKILKAINRGECSRYRGTLDEKGVKKVLRDADVLVHAESFTYLSQRVTRLSVSTKIPEYMAMGKCILAFGPKDVASIEYIQNTGTGYVIDSTQKGEIDRVLKEIILRPEQREAFAKRALDIAKKNHDEKIKRAEFHHLLLKCPQSPESP